MKEKSKAATDIQADTTYYVDSTTTIGDIKAKLVATDSATSSAIGAVVAAVVGKGPSDTRDGTKIGAVKAITLTYTDSTGGKFVVTVEGSAASLKVAQAAVNARLAEENQTSLLLVNDDVRNVTRFTIPMPSGTLTLPSSDDLKQFFAAKGPDGTKLSNIELNFGRGSDPLKGTKKLEMAEDFVVIGFASSSGSRDVFSVTVTLTN